MSDKTLNAMIANFAVMEQLLINLTHLVSEDFEDPAGIRAALVQDLRDRFRVTDGSDTTKKALYRLANEQLDRLEPRVIGNTADLPKQ